MRKIKDEAKHYLETKILGAYETADIVWQSDLDGNICRTFDDSELSRENDNLMTERKMMVDGKVFTVCSIFPIAPNTTPTEKLLKIIDTSVEIGR